MKHILTCVLLGTCLTTVLACCVFFMSAVEKVREDAERADDSQFAVCTALFSYHDAHGRLPPAVIRGPNGKPLYSWRVAILSYVDAGPLYNEFHLDEPWDSPHNITLLPKMPPCYAGPGRRRAGTIPPFHTIIHVFVGKGTPFEGDLGLNLRNDFPDGLANTLLVVETGKPVPWSKPGDLSYDPDQPLPDLKGYFHDGFWAVTANYKRRWVKNEMSEATLRALITRNGNDQPGDDWQENVVD
jgi:hypothetical protein